MPTFFLAQTGTAQSHEDIAWSSSDSEQSDDGNSDQRHITALVQQKHKRPTAPIQTCGKVMCKLGTDEGVCVCACVPVCECKGNACTLAHTINISEMQLICKLHYSIFLSVEDPPVIDTDSDQNRSEDDADKDSGQQISDCDSDPCDDYQEAMHLTSANVSNFNFSVYSLKAINAEPF